MREYEEMPKRKKKRSSLTSKRIVLLFLLIIGIVLGAVLEHYFVEPLIEEQSFQKYVNCESKVELLDKQIDDCIECLGENNIEISSCEQ